MKQLTFFLLGFAFLFTVPALAQGVLITDDPEAGLNAKPNPNAVLHLRSSSRALLLPALSRRARDEFRGRREGFLFFDRNTNFIAFTDKSGEVVTVDVLLDRLLRSRVFLRPVTLNLAATAFVPPTIGGVGPELVASLPIPEGSRITKLVLHYRAGEAPLRLAVRSELLTEDETADLGSTLTVGKSATGDVTTTELVLDAVARPFASHTVSVSAATAGELRRIRGVSVTYEPAN